MDRIQCHEEIPVGSGRPTEDELRGSTRTYLAGRPVSAGPIAASTAVDRLVALQQRFLHDGGTQLILEGGSISVLQELIRRTDWSHCWLVRIEVCIEASPRQYEARVAERVEQMIGYGTGIGGARTLQHELEDLWSDPAARKQAAAIVGFREAIELCEQQGLLPQELTGRPGRLWRHRLFDRILAAHLAYAGRQREAIATALPELSDHAEEVELCET